MKPRQNSAFARDFASAVDKFPKLKYELDEKRKSWIITGDLDICDLAGTYWGTFDIRVFVPQNYPHCVPIVQEVSTLIRRDVDWHIDENGICCIDINHKLIHMARMGINLTDFMTLKVYPFFANQLFKMKKGIYAGEEYQHYFAGVVQFYLEDLSLNEEQAISMLEAILGQTVGRNGKCPCGSLQKLKNCHLTSFSFLKGMDRDQLREDLASFNKLASPIKTA